MAKAKLLIKKRASTIILRGAIIAIGLVIATILAILFPLLLSSYETTDYYKPILIGLYVPAIPFFFALYQSLKILNYIDKDKAFSEKSVTAFRNIKYCAITISTLFILGMPYIFYVGDTDDAPGVILIALIIIGASFAIAAFAGLIQKLVQNAVDIKSENDLTV
jgi:hypothetical protein